MNPAAFAEVLCEDLQIPDSTDLVPLIVQQIIEQVEDFRSHAPLGISEDAQTARGSLIDDRLDSTASLDVAADASDLRIPVQINIVFEKKRFHDQFEWDVTGWRNSPESFAAILVREERLQPEFQ